ncbi:amidase [Simplicispira suum]|nr:amidase [Simplicispira suum]
MMRQISFLWVEPMEALMRADDILDRDALDQAALVRNGEVTPLELVTAAIERCEKINPHINAVTQPLYELAREEVLMAKDGPFRGVPFLVKDFYCHMAGTVTSGSSSLLLENRVDHDSELMRRYRAAGLVTIGKSNVPEMVSVGTTEPRLFGATKNPWNLAHTPGGSSGGAAAAVAAGIVPVAHANDGAGSTRIPAACCGLFGLKPSRGRITLGPDVGESIGGITAEHVVSRSVRDSAAMLDATQGSMPGDPYVAPPSPMGYLDATRSSPGRLRIALSLEAMLSCQVDPECQAAAQATAQLCESLGHHVDLASPPIDIELFRAAVEGFWPMTITRVMVAMAQSRQVDVDTLVSQLEPFNQHLFSLGIRRSAVEYLQGLVFFQAATRTLGRFFETYDVLLTPTLSFGVPRLGYFDAQIHGGTEAYRRVIDSFAFTVPANVTGIPAASMPMAVSKSGLPIGVQISTRFGCEHTLFQLATQLEATSAWKKPPPSAKFPWSN